MTTHPSDPAVAAFVTTLADDATMSGDGTARDLAVWAEREV